MIIAIYKNPADAGFFLFSGMKKIGLLLQLFSIFCLAQSPSDSLKKLLQTANHDSVRARIMAQITEVCELEDIPDYADRIIEIYEKHKGESVIYLKYKATALNNLAFVKDAEGKSRECLNLYTQAYTIRKEIKDFGGAGNSLYNRAILYRQIGESDSARQDLQLALTFLKKVDHKLGVANCIFTLGEIALREGELVKAQDLIEQSLKIRKEINDKSGIAICYSSLGTIYGEQEDYDNEEIFQNKAIAVQQEIGDFYGLGLSYNNLANVYLARKQYERAMRALHQARESFLKISELPNLALVYHNLGCNYIEWKKLDSARYYLLKGISLRKQIDDKEGYYVSLAEYGKLLLNFGNKDSSFYYLKNAYENSVKYNFLDIRRNTSGTLSRIYADRGDFKTAYHFHVEHKQLHDSLFNLTVKKNSFKQQARFEYEIKEAIAKAETDKMQLLHAEEKQKQLLIIISVSLIALLMIVFGVFMYRRYKLTQQQKLIIEEKELETRKQKHLIEEKQKEILDSIHYARRIQRNLMPREKQIDKIIRLLKDN